MKLGNGLVKYKVQSWWKWVTMGFLLYSFARFCPNVPPSSVQWRRIPPQLIFQRQNSGFSFRASRVNCNCYTENYTSRSRPIDWVQNGSRRKYNSDTHSQKWRAPYHCGMYSNIIKSIIEQSMWRNFESLGFCPQLTTDVMNRITHGYQVPQPEPQPPQQESGETLSENNNTIHGTVKAQRPSFRHISIIIESKLHFIKYIGSNFRDSETLGRDQGRRGRGGTRSAECGFWWSRSSGDRLSSPSPEGEGWGTCSQRFLLEVKAKGTGRKGKLYKVMV